MLAVYALLLLFVSKESILYFEALRGIKGTARMTAAPVEPQC